MTESTRKLKRVIIKEEFVELTGSYIGAVLLGQLIYWSERVKDFDEFIKQEAEAENKEPEGQLYGWMYKSYKELSEETMLGLVPSVIKSHLKKLIDKGFVSVRDNKHKWDRRKEYKINLICIQKELHKLGYSLEGYSLILPFSENENRSSENENRNAENRKTVTETTAETTTNNNSLSSDRTADEGKIKFDEDSDEIKIVNFFIEKLKGINLKIKVPVTLKQKQKWATDIDRLMRLDGKDKGEICKVIVFATKDNFWCSNILSATSLRKHYDKLVIKMQKGSIFGKPSDNTYTSASAVSETEKMLAERRKEREAMLNDA